MRVPFSKVLDDKKLFGTHFAGDSWNFWKQQWKEMESRNLREFWLCKGRGSGGSRMLAAKALHSCIFEDWLKYLAPGEVATALILATDKRQASETFGYVDGLIREIPAIKRMVIRQTAEVIEFNNHTRIEVRVSNFRKVRGYTLCFAGLDELAFWQDSTTGANPARQVYNALLPALGRLKGSFLMAISTPWSASGFFADQIRKYQSGNHPEVFALIAETLKFNPTFSVSVIEQAYEDDSIAARSEYAAQFRSDLEPFISRDVVQACTIPGRFELPPLQGATYYGFADPSGGSQDSYTLAISHNDNGMDVLDCIREIRPPFSPESATKELAEVLKAYRCTQVSGDKYAGSWPSDAFAKHNIRYVPSTHTKSEIYLESLPLLNSGKVELLENRKLISQLCSLERRSRVGGRDTIDHPPGGHDDLINASCGALLLANQQSSSEAFRKAFIETPIENFVGPRRKDPCRGLPSHTTSINTFISQYRREQQPVYERSHLLKSGPQTDRSTVLTEASNKNGRQRHD